jgi:hypothetical protein
MNYQFLKINPEKTELLLFYPKAMESKVIIRGTMINDKECVRFSDVVKNVGVWLDKNLELNYHINKIVSHSFKILKDIGRIRSVLSKKHTEMLVHAVITNRMDNCNSLFFNMNKSNLNKLQKIQNAAARIVVQKRKRQSISGDIRNLHWLRVESRIVFKILVLVFKSILDSTRSQCKFLMSPDIDCLFLFCTTILAAAFCIFCNLFRLDLFMLKNKLLQLSILFVMTACTSISVCFLDRTDLILPMSFNILNEWDTILLI